MISLSAQQAPRIDASGTDTETQDRFQASGLGSIPDSPTRILGATGLLDCKFWSTDFRERLDEDDPLREGFEASPADGSSESVARLEKLHNVALLLTTIDR